MSNIPRKSSSSKSSPLIPLLIGIGVVLLLAVIFYFVGLSKGRGELASQKTASEKQLGDIHTQLAAAQGQVKTLQTQNRLLTAREFLYRAAVSLDRRNFGTANDNVQKAAAQLQPLQAGDIGDFGRLSALRTDIANTNIQVAADLDAQRQQILELAARMDSLLPPG